MVMETPPSPQCVGREFVRQYYTLLNKAPSHLHRFYNQQSSFIHGGLDQGNRDTYPVIGQKKIHHKIQQLNFRDCHAKIAQVDSQATLGNGVVVQVTGELSSCGLPMRRFTQTFVLAAQSPKKYYVHNDIFRYQDEIISDEEGDVENISEVEDDPKDCANMPDLVQQQPQQSAVVQQPPLQYYAANNPTMQTNLTNIQSHHQQQPDQSIGMPPTVNGNVHPDDIKMITGPTAVSAHAVNASGQVVTGTMGNMQQSGGMVQSINNPTSMGIENQVNTNSLIDEKTKDLYEPTVHTEQMEIPSETASASNEPKTYANLLKSGNAFPYNSQQNIMGSMPPTVPQQQYQQVAQQVQPPPRPVTPPSNQREYNGGRPNMNRGIQRGNQQPRVPRQDSDDYRRSYGGGNFNDPNQLFLGNVPLTVTEDELCKRFSQYGTVLNLRVYNKDNMKSGSTGGRPTPNYAFITFETQEDVQKCLDARPIKCTFGDNNDVILNVEERKMSNRMPYGGGNGGGASAGRNLNENRLRESGSRPPPRGAGVNRGGGGGGSGFGMSGGPTGITPNRSNYNRANSGPHNRGQKEYVRR